MQRLRIGAADFVGAVDQAFDRVGDVVRLVDHVRRIEVVDAALFGIDQLVEDQEQAVGLDRAGVEVVVAILGIVEVEAAELAELDQTGDDHLDIGVGRMMAEVDQAVRLGSKRLGDQVVGAPVLDDGRIEGRLVHLVLGKQLPVIRQRLVDVAPSRRDNVRRPW